MSAAALPRGGPGRRLAAALARLLPPGSPLHAPELGPAEREAVADCLASGWVSYAAPQVRAFEADLARHLGTADAVATCSGTAALHLALASLGVGPGDEVLMPALTFVATANAARYCGAEPHFVDVEPETLGVDPEALARHLARTAAPDGRGGARDRRTGRRLAALVVVHAFGRPALMEGLREVAGRFGLPVVEDAAQALGSARGDTPAGRLGRLAAFSFNGNKVITAGGGGALVGGDRALLERARHLATTARRPHPWRLEHDAVGFNYRMPGLNAALARAQLGRLPGLLARKEALAARYREALAGLATFLEARPAWTPLHRLPMYRDRPRAALPVTEAAARELLCLPSGPGLAEALRG